MNVSNFCNCKVPRELPKEPLYPADDLYGIVGDNLKKPFDVKEVRKNEISSQWQINGSHGFFGLLFESFYFKAEQ